MSYMCRMVSDIPGIYRISRGTTFMAQMNCIMGLRRRYVCMFVSVLFKPTLYDVFKIRIMHFINLTHCLNKCITS